MFDITTCHHHIKLGNVVRSHLCNVSDLFFPVNVVMKGSHGYISITEWPLMIVSI